MKNIKSEEQREYWSRLAGLATVVVVVVVGREISIFSVDQEECPSVPLATILASQYCQTERDGGGAGSPTS